MTPEQIDMRNKLLEGICISYNRLIEKKQKENGELFFFRDGEIVEIKANQLCVMNTQISSFK